MNLVAGARSMTYVMSGIATLTSEQGKEEGGTAGSQAVPTSHRSTQKEEKPLITDRAYQGLARDRERATAPQPLCQAKLAAETRGHPPPQHFLPSVYSTVMVTN